MYVLNEPQRHRTLVRWLFAVLLIGVLAGVAGWFMLNHRHSAATPEKPVAAAAYPKPVSGVSTHMLIVGDLFWGRSVQTKAEKSGLGYRYITSKFSAADRAQYNAWIANFECPITTKDVPYSLQVSILKFNCRPEYLPELAKWFTVAGQANNHTDNNGGIWGLEQTRANLQTAGIQYFGTYDMDQTSDICEVVSLPATTTGTHKTVAIPVAFCGYMYVVDRAPTDAQLAVMRQYAKVMPVIAMPHMGVEYRQTAEPEKVSAYHRMIDAGADVVIGAHPHVIQNSESYKGRLIAYSEGNFLFDQQILGRAETLGLGVGIKLTIDDPKAAAIYERVAPSCEAYKDDCLSKLTAELKTRPKIDVAYNFTCYDEASGLPALGDAAACQQAKTWATIDQLTDLSTRW